MLSLVGIPSPEKRIDEYPHNWWWYAAKSRSRCLILQSEAIDCRRTYHRIGRYYSGSDSGPDERSQKELGTAIIMITHDLGVIAELVDQVVVMYTGIIVERGDVETIFANPQHPYTQGLLASIPRLDMDVERLQAIPGSVPTPGNFPKGCGFHPRCPYAKDICEAKRPPAFKADGEGHYAACWKLVDYQDVTPEELKEVR